MDDILTTFKYLYDFIFWDVIFLLISIAGGLGTLMACTWLGEKLDKYWLNTIGPPDWFSFLSLAISFGVFVLIGYLIDFPQYDTFLTLGGMVVLSLLVLLVGEFFRIFVYGILFIENTKFPVLGFTLRAIGVLGFIWFVAESPNFLEAVERWWFFNIEIRTGIEIIGILLLGILGGYLLAGLFLRIQEFFIESKDEDSLPNSKEAFIARLCFCTLGIIFAFFVSS